MKYANPELRQMLAAQYVLGTLRGAARRRFEALSRVDAELRREQHFWESRLAGLASEIAPQSPPPEIWQALEQRVGRDRDRDRTRAVSADAPATGANVTPIRRPAPSTPPAAAAPKPASPWRIVAGLATAAAVVVAVLVSNRTPLPGTEPVAAPGPVAVAPVPSPAQSPAAPTPVYVSLLRLPDSDMQWTLAVTPEARQIKALASGSYPKLGEHSLELWLIDDGKPISLGLLPTAGEGRLTLPKGVTGETLTLAVSLEPVGGAPEGKPTGPVLTSGPALRAI